MNELVLGMQWRVSEVYDESVKGVYDKSVGYVRWKVSNVYDHGECRRSMMDTGREKDKI